MTVLRRIYQKTSWLFWLVYSLGLSAKESVEIDPFQKNPNVSNIRPGDYLLVDVFENASDPFLEGYIQALIDTNYYDYNVGVSVHKHYVTLYNLPHNELIANSIISFVENIPGVICVKAKSKMPNKELCERYAYTQSPRISGVWFPQETVLFLPLLASPREPVYSVNYRIKDRVIGKEVIAVSLGDDFPLFRWHNVGSFLADVQIGISAGVWTVFNFSPVPYKNADVCELVNTDYLVGSPLTYTVNKWSFRMRFYHISGHLGDEFIVGRPEYIEKRKNPSFEAIDLVASFQFSSDLRIYIGPGCVVSSDSRFKLKPLYLMWGSEIRTRGNKLLYHRLYGTPFFAMHIENWQQHKWGLGLSIKLGYEISKLQGVGRKMRVHFTFHDGYSYEGQFFNFPTRYGELGFSWGF